MAVTQTQNTNGEAHPAELNASKLVINLANELKPLPAPESLAFGETKTDHMLIVNYDPVTGWSTPEIKPYGPLILDPASSCFQYCPNVFEGMKAYAGPDGKPRLFRPQKNMERLTRSAERVALPPFDTNELLKLIQRLVAVESRWIPSQPGYSLYIRPTVIGTRAALGVAASDSACLYVIVSPTGPYFRGGTRPISLLAVGEHARSWPGGTGGHKLGLNYAPGFMPQRLAAKLGYEQILWLLGDDKKITEVGAMNVFVAIKRDDGDLDVLTPPLDGTILPGLTRASCIALTEAHNTGRLVLPGISPSQKLHTAECPVTMAEIVAWSEQGRLVEAFGVGTAVVVAPIGRIGFEGKDIILPIYEAGLGPLGKGLWETLTAIQVGKLEYDDWSVKCE
ncbi:aminotransferase [Crucibulum laeve]|uniref:Branched-chain-amino-acid aminotransferase n=1 Tax=Crucibulum laeve TaxID=68775 RepID=A0A5C3M259_9AGAR|nr:aminotransferase [Crucibulum laeve]